MAEDADHSRAVEKATNDQEDSVDGSENHDKASHGVRHRPVAACLLAVDVARFVYCKHQVFGSFLVRVGAINELDVVKCGVLPVRVIESCGGVPSVLNCQHVSPLLHLVAT